MNDLNLFYFGIMAFSLMVVGIALTILEFKTIEAKPIFVREKYGRQNSKPSREYYYAPEKRPTEIRH